MAAGDITVVGSDKSTENNTASSTVQWADLDGAGLAANDTCVLFWEHSNAATETVTPTSQGFTQIDTVTDGTSVLTAYKKTCTGSETGSITVTTSVVGRKSLFGIVLRGALDVAILNTGGDAGTDANHTPPAATPTSDGCGALIALGEHSGTAATATPPSGYTEVLEENISGSGASFGYIAYKGSAGLLDKLTNGVAETPGNIVSDASGSNVTYMTLIITPAVTNYTQTPADPEGITDSATRVVDGARSQADPVGISDSAARITDGVRSTDDPTGITDATTLARATVAADPVGMTDSATDVVDVVRSQADPVGATDAAAFLLDGVRAPADPVAATDAASMVVDSVRMVADPEAITDAVTLQRATSSADPVGITDTAAPVAGVVRSQADAVGLSDAATAARGLAVSDPVGATDGTSTLLDAVRVVGDPVGLSDSVIASFAGDSSASPADAVGIADAATDVLAADRTTTDSVGISDSVSVSVVVAAVASDPVGIVDEISAVMARVVTVVDFLGILDGTVQSGGADRDITATGTLIRDWHATLDDTGRTATLDRRGRTGTLQQPSHDGTLEPAWRGHIDA